MASGGGVQKVDFRHHYYHAVRKTRVATVFRIFRDRIRSWRRRRDRPLTEVDSSLFSTVHSSSSRSRARSTQPALIRIFLACSAMKSREKAFSAETGTVPPLPDRLYSLTRVQNVDISYDWKVQKRRTIGSTAQSTNDGRSSAVCRCPLRCTSGDR